MHTLFSIGHGSRTKEVLLELLQRYGIQYLIDVRSKPFSRFHKQYNRDAIDSYLAEHGIRYVYMGDLLGGRPSDPACLTDGKVDYRKLRQQSFYKNGIARLRTAYDKQIPAAIMCSERNPAECHRSRLIGQSLMVCGIAIQHIDEAGNLQTHDELVKKFQQDPRA